MRTIALLLLLGCDPKEPTEDPHEDTEDYDTEDYDTEEDDTGDSGGDDTGEGAPDDKEGEAVPPEDVEDYDRDAVYLDAEYLSVSVMDAWTDRDALLDLLRAMRCESGGFGDAGKDCGVFYAVGVKSGWDDEALSFRLDLRNPAAGAVLSGVDPADHNPDGEYTIVDLLVIDYEDPICSMMWYDAPTAATIEHHQGGRADLKGGMCAVLTVAHSLYRSMGQIVPAETATTTTDGTTTWDPDFLRGIYNNSGDTDGNRGLSSDEFVQAHTGNYSEDWSIRAVQSNVSLYRSESLTCEQIQERCTDLKTTIDDSNDDFAMGWQGTYKGRSVGHMVPVTGASYTAGPPCCCEIATIQTRVQEPEGAAMWTGVPVEPGTATYSVCRVDDQTVIRQTEFSPRQPNRFVITDLYWFQFDEEIKAD